MTIEFELTFCVKLIKRTALITMAEMGHRALEGLVLAPVLLLAMVPPLLQLLLLLFKELTVIAIVPVGGMRIHPY